MTDRTEDSGEIEKLYKYCEKLNEAKDKSLNKVDYEGIIAAANGSVKAKQLAAQMIPKFFKFFPDLSEQALDQHLYLCEDEELGVRVQAIRGLPFFCKDTPEHLAKIVDILGQLLVAGDNVERDAVHKALMMLLRQDVKKNIPDDTTNNHTTSDPGESLFMMVVQHQYKLAELVKSSYGSGHKRRSINRERAAGHTQLVNDYFSMEPVYTDDIFRRRFRMRKELFLRIVNVLENHPDGYFKWREDAARRKGLSPLQKCTVAIRQLAYGGPACQLDEYLRMGVTTALECLSNFCQCVMQIYGSVYLRKPNASDITRLLPMHEQRHGFPGMLGSLDCMHWAWKNCPITWRTHYTLDDHGYPTIVLGAVASADLWIWHAFFGVSGSRNDINLLNESPFFNEVLKGNTLEANFIVNGTQYTKGYYLTNDIYSECATFVKSFSCPQDLKKRKFKERQEAARKDVEQAFGVLQARWAIIRGPGRHWLMDKCKEIISTCLILHNMIVEDEGPAISIWDHDEQDTFIVNQGSTPAFGEYLRRNSKLCDSQVHHQIRHDLVEYIWETCSRD